MPYILNMMELIILPGVIFTPGFLAYSLLLLAIILVGFFNFNKLSKPYKVLVVMITLIFISELTGKFLQARVDTNSPAYHVSLFIQHICFGLLFYYLIPLTNKLRAFILILGFTLALTAILTGLFYQGLFTFPSISASLLSVFVSVCSIYLFYSMIKSPVNTPLLKQAWFWFASGSLFFYSITFFVLGYFKLLLESPSPVPDWCYDLLHFANFVLYGCYLTTIILAAKSKLPTHEPR